MWLRTREIIVINMFVIVLQADRKPSCGDSVLTELSGTIQSPHYPKPFDSQVQCEWVIKCPKQSVLRLEILDLDLNENCSQHWLSVPFEGGRGENILCGRKFSLVPITVAQPLTYIKYYSSEIKKLSRGFALRYAIENLKCSPFDLHCLSGECVSNSSRCDGFHDCQDGSDEFGCPVATWCRLGTMPCLSTPSHCFPVGDFCNGNIVCPHGEDEMGCSLKCPNQIACASGDGCYDPSQRCNGIRNCRDNSDETGCLSKICAPLDFVCRNSQCIPSTSICDGIDDCGDKSDEQNCSKSNLVTAATLGLLTCACLSCIGLVLIYRFILTRMRHSTSPFDPLDIEQELPEIDTDDGFVYREPPPSYSAAVAEYTPLPPPVRPAARRNRRRQRRPQLDGHSKRNMMLPVSDPRQRTPVSSSSVSPSRESMTSATSVEDLLLQ